MVHHPGEAVVGLSPHPSKVECEDLLAFFFIKMRVNDGSRDAVRLLSQSFASDAET